MFKYDLPLSKVKKKKQKTFIKIVMLPHWPSPAGQERWDVPLLHSDTFIEQIKT